jgi:hypothetical protein
MHALAGDFADRNAVCRWTGKYRVADGCTSADILYDTVSEIPSPGFRQLDRSHLHRRRQRVAVDRGPWKAAAVSASTCCCRDVVGLTAGNRMGHSRPRSAIGSHRNV